jgi:hypothetical protein
VFAANDPMPRSVDNHEDEYVTNVQIKSVHGVRTVIGSIDHIVRPFDITGSRVPLYDEREVLLVLTHAVHLPEEQQRHQ